MFTRSDFSRAERGAVSGEAFSPSDRKVIRMEEWRRDRLHKRPPVSLAKPLPEFTFAAWMIPSNDPNPPPAAPAAALRRAA